jgi:hypothetical protein
VLAEIPCPKMVKIRENISRMNLNRENRKIFQ